MFELEGEVLNEYQKPLSLMAKFIKLFTKEGDYIVDVTAGTCTTAVRTHPGFAQAGCCLTYSVN